MEKNLTYFFFFFPGKKEKMGERRRKKKKAKRLSDQLRISIRMQSAPE